MTATAVRIETVTHVGRPGEGENPKGCPQAKWIYTRQTAEEKVIKIIIAFQQLIENNFLCTSVLQLLCLVRERVGHTCETAVLCISAVLWDGINDEYATKLYKNVVTVVPYGGKELKRGNSQNKRSDSTFNPFSFYSGAYLSTC